MADETEALQQTQFSKHMGAQGGKIRAGGKPGRSDPRGNSAARNKRALKLTGEAKLQKGERDWGGHNGSVVCVHCGRLAYRHPPVGKEDQQLHQDRIEPGGAYAYHNIQPSCKRCNQLRSNDPNWKYDGSY